MIAEKKFRTFAVDLAQSITRSTNTQWNWSKGRGKEGGGEHLRSFSIRPNFEQQLVQPTLEIYRKKLENTFEKRWKSREPGDQMACDLREKWGSPSITWKHWDKIKELVELVEGQGQKPLRLIWTHTNKRWHRNNYLRGWLKVTMPCSYMIIFEKDLM